MCKQLANSKLNTSSENSSKTKLTALGHAVERRTVFVNSFSSIAPLKRRVLVTRLRGQAALSMGGDGERNRANLNLRQTHAGEAHVLELGQTTGSTYCSIHVKIT